VLPLLRGRLGNREAKHLDTLAAAYAECGKFQQAMEWDKKAIELCEDQKNAQAFQERLALYQQGRPYRLSP
jgi:tetratricopeptide (TPR) repeat protein